MPGSQGFGPGFLCLPASQATQPARRLLLSTRQDRGLKPGQRLGSVQGGSGVLDDPDMRQADPPVRQGTEGGRETVQQLHCLAHLPLDRPVTRADRCGDLRRHRALRQLSRPQTPRRNTLPGTAVVVHHLRNLGRQSERVLP